ncbi:hypothetical protein BOX15_Mlig003326g2, partial [Macrostomum lignano]
IDSHTLMAALRLRCRISTGGQVTLDSLTSGSSAGDLAEAIYSAAKIGRDHELHVKFGYPPKPLDLSQPASTLSSLGLTSGEALIVEAKRSTQWQQEKAAQLDSVLSSQVESGAGFLSVQTIPANNSCLFLAIDFCVSNRAAVDLDSAAPMRQAIAQAVSADPATYTAAFLDRENPAYCQWILSPNSWGGAIELSILCRRLGVQINVIDTQTGRMDSYPAENAVHKIFLIYDGIHYDAVAMETLEGAGGLTTRFPISDESVDAKALELGKEAKSAGQFTDMSKFQLRCGDCGVYLRGEAEARQHAKSTGHTSFTETKPAAS